MDTRFKNRRRKINKNGAFRSQNMKSLLYTSWQQEAFPYDKDENTGGKKPLRYGRSAYTTSIP